MYYINIFKSAIEFFNKQNIFTKIFIVFFYFVLNYVIVATPLLANFLSSGNKSSLHYISVIILNIVPIYAYGGQHDLTKIVEKYKEKYNKFNITDSDEEALSKYLSDPDYKKEHSIWQINFAIYNTVLLVLLILSVVFL